MKVVKLKTNTVLKLISLNCIPQNLDMNLVREDGGSPKKKSKKRLSVERIYQKKTQLEHILLRPDSYVGSIEPITQSMWVYDENLQAIVNRDISFVPGLYKIFDEILGKNVNHFNSNYCDTKLTSELHINSVNSTLFQQ